MVAVVPAQSLQRGGAKTDRPYSKAAEGCHISASPLQLMTLASAREMRFPPPPSAIPLENSGTTFEANKTFSALV